MPLAEIPYRVSHFAKQRYDKLTAPNTQSGTCHPDSVNIFHLDVSQALGTIPRISQLAQETGDRICDHRFEIFGQLADFGQHIDWYLDITTRKSWPMQFWGDIDYRDGQTIGGIKFAWELNRLHHFPQLAIASVITGNKKYEREIFDQLRSWLNANPYPLGINWISGIEIGIRIVNLVYALKILPNAPTSDDYDTVTEFIYRHATHLLRFPSKHTSAANHAVAEALGLFVAGISFPGFSASSKWKRFGKQVLEREVLRQIYPDGSSFEHTFPYLQFVVDHYLVYLLLCKEHGERYSEDVPVRMRSALHFIRSMLDDNGNFPAIGDDDSGYLMKLWFGEHNNFISILNAGALLFDDGALAINNATPDLKTLLLLGPERPITTSQSKRPDPSIEFFKDSGLAVIRVRHPTNLLFVGNSGPLGLEPLAAHGHADALSFWLSVDGQPVFVDPGTYLYHSGGIWRDYFRSTAAHNTIRIDASDQARIISDFMFDNFYDILGARLVRQGNQIVWKAAHNGYSRLRDPVRHQRTVTLDVEEARFSIQDEIFCDGHHVVESYFHLHPDCNATIEDNFVRIENKSSLITMFVDDQWREVDAIKGDNDCHGGWYSREFNALQETVSLRLRTEVSGNATFVTIIDCASARA